MNENFERVLLTLCPTIYRDTDKTLMCYGFSFSDGWFNLILNLSLKLENMSKMQKGAKIRIAQCKEKFGTLVVYSDNTTVEMSKIIREFEQRSEWICEFCGSQDKSVKTEGLGWIRTLCKDCRKSKT